MGQDPKLLDDRRLLGFDPRLGRPLEVGAHAHFAPQQRGLTHEPLYLRVLQPCALVAQAIRPRPPARQPDRRLGDPLAAPPEFLLLLLAGLLLRGHRALLANVGDCRALVVRAESSHAPPYVQLTTDQRATEPGEQSRILKAGGQISDGRVWGALIPSRTLGDFPWKAKGPGLSALPEFCSYEIGPDDRYVILGSDGLFDVLTNKAIARIAGRMSGKAQKVANELVKELKKRPGHDDQTLVVVALEH